MRNVSLGLGKAAAAFPVSITVSATNEQGSVICTSAFAEEQEFGVIQAHR